MPRRQRLKCEALMTVLWSCRSAGVPGLLGGRDPAQRERHQRRGQGQQYRLAASGLVPPGDKGYIGEDDIRTRTGGGTPASQKHANRGQAQIRARQCPAQQLADLAEAPLLPLARRATGHKPSTSVRPAKPEDDKRLRKYDGART